MKIGTKLILGFAVIGVLVAVVSIIAVVQIERGLKELGEFHTPALYSIQSMAKDSMGAAEESFAYISSGEKSEKEEFLERLERFNVEAEKFRKIAKLDEPGEEEEKELFEAIVADQRLLGETSKAMFGEFEAKGTISHEVFMEYEDVVDRLDLNLEKFVNIEIAEVEEAHLDVIGVIKKSERLAYGIGILALILAITLGYIISRGISSPIIKLKDAAVEIGKGKLDTKVAIKSKDEIGFLADSFNKMTEDLKKSVQKEKELASVAAAAERARREAVEERAKKLTDSRTAMIHMLKRLDKTGKELAAARDYTDNIIKSMIDTLLVVDPGGNIKTINKATSDLLGYKDNELVGKPVATIFAEEEEEVTPFKGTKMRKLIEEGSIRDYDMTYKTKSGEKIPVSFSGSVMRDKDGELIGIVGIARDMREIKRLMEKEKELAAAAAAAATDRKRTVELEKAYSELRETQAKLIEKEKLAALGELGAGAAHELNNPLAGIMGFTELVLSDVKNNSINHEEIIENLETVMQDSYRCKNIVANLLNYARGKEPEKTENDISGIIEESLDIVERQGVLKDIKVIKGYGMDLPKVYVDKGQMTQVFVNILVNAHKAMPNGGEIFIKSWLDKNYVVIEFKDTGTGIEKENLGKVFDPFFTTHRPGGGAGLGLSVCYSIIKSHRGEIEARSEGEDKGASFVVKIPV